MPGVGAEAGLGPKMQEALAQDPSILGKLLEIPKAKRDQERAKLEEIGGLLLGVETAPAVQRPTMYAMARQQYIAGGGDASTVPESYDSVWVRTTIARAGEHKTLLGLGAPPHATENREFMALNAKKAPPGDGASRISCIPW